MELAHSHHQRVKLIKVLQMFGGIVLVKCLLSKLLQFAIAGTLACQLVPRGNAPQILIDNHYRVPKRVEQNSVCCFRTDAWELEELLSEIRGRYCRQPLERPCILSIKEFHKGPDSGGFTKHVARRADQQAKFFRGSFT